MAIKIDLDRIGMCSAELTSLAQRIERDIRSNEQINHTYLWCKCAIPGGTSLYGAMRAGGFLTRRPGFRNKLLAVYGEARKHQEWFKRLIAGIATAVPPDDVAAGKMFEYAVCYWLCGNSGYDRQRLRRRFTDDIVIAEAYRAVLLEISASLCATRPDI